MFRSAIGFSFARIVDLNSATSCRSSSMNSSFNFFATFDSQSASKRSEEKYMDDVDDAPIDRFIIASYVVWLATGLLQDDRCRMLCLALSRAFRDRRRGAGDNVVNLESMLNDSLNSSQR